MDGCAINGFHASTPWLAPLRSARTVFFNSLNAPDGTKSRYSAAFEAFPCWPSKASQRASNCRSNCSSSA